MRKFFENPEIAISLFDAESVATTVSDPTLTAAKDAVGSNTLKLKGMGDNGAANAAATTIFAFKE